MGSRVNRLLPLAAVALLASVAAVAPSVASGAIFADSPEAALINREAIQDATGELTLPRGVISVDRAPVLTGDNSGLKLRGKGATIQCKRTAGGYIDRAALAI